MTTKWKVVRIRDSNYQRAIKDAKYLETFDSIFAKLLDIRDKANKEKN